MKGLDLEMPQIRQKGQRVEGSHGHKNSTGCKVWGENAVKVRGGIARLDRVQERPAFTARSETVTITAIRFLKPQPLANTLPSH